MVYLEHPVGVGFSEAPDGLKWNDITVPAETWTNQAASSSEWTEQTVPSTDWTTLGKQDAA